MRIGTLGATAMESEILRDLLEISRRSTSSSWSTRTLAARRRVAGWGTIIFFEGNSSRMPWRRKMKAHADLPGWPPSRPRGADVNRSPRWEIVTSVVVAS